MFVPPFSTTPEALELLAEITSKLTITPPEPLTVQQLLLSHARAGGDGQFRKGGASPHWVPVLVEGLVQWYNSSPAHPLIRAAVFRHEFLSIAPFSIGNESLAARLHADMLTACHPDLGSTELNFTLTATDATELISASLHAILAALRRKPEKAPEPTPRQRHQHGPIDQILAYLRRHPGSKRQDILNALPTLSPRMLDRHLQNLRETRQIEYRGSRKTGAYYAS